MHVNKLIKRALPIGLRPITRDEKSKAFLLLSPWDDKLEVSERVQHRALLYHSNDKLAKLEAGEKAQPLEKQQAQQYAKEKKIAKKTNLDVVDNKIVIFSSLQLQNPLEKWQSKPTVCYGEYLKDLKGLKGWHQQGQAPTTLRWKVGSKPPITSRW